MSDIGVEITKVRDETLEDICEIERDIFSSPYPSYILAAMAKETPETFLVATSKERTIGYILATVRRDSGHIISIAVRNEFRRRGVGTRLLTEIMQVLQEKRLRQVDLEVRASNLPAQKFYRKLGFQESGLIRQYYHDREDAVIMSRKLP